MNKDIIGIWDLPDEKIYVKLKNHCRRSFFNYAIELAGSINKLEKLVTTKNLREYKEGIYFTPLRVIRRVLELFSIDKKNEFIDSIGESVEELRYGYRLAKSIKNPKLPFKFSLILSRIAGHLVGDGGVRIEKDDRTVYYANKSLILINQFKEDILTVFGEIEPYEFTDERDGTHIVKFPSIVGLILTIYFGPLVADLKSVPDLILNSNKNHKINFLKALFDDEASVSITERRIQFEMANELIVENVKKMLEGFGIRPGKTGKRREAKNHKMKYRFNICGKQDLEIFDKEIGFDHPKRKKRLETLLKNYQRIQYKRGEIRKLMFETLKKNGKTNVYELAKKLKRKPVFRFREQLRRLEKEGLIKSEIGRGKRNTIMKVYYV